MARKLDQIIVIDIEATCWPGPPPDGQESEIIEIGICPVDVATGERLEKRNILVQPTRSKVSAFCTELTGLTQREVSKGMPFRKACALLEREYLTRKRIWASYGDYDRHLFLRQCDLDGVEYPFSPGHINVKSLFGLINMMPYEVGLAHALEIANLEYEGRPHRGGDDAWNIGRLLSGLLLQQKFPTPES